MSLPFSVFFLFSGAVDATSPSSSKKQTKQKQQEQEQEQKEHSKYSGQHYWQTDWIHEMRSNQSNTVKYHFLDIFVIKLQKPLTSVQA